MAGISQRHWQEDWNSNLMQVLDLLQTHGIEHSTSHHHSRPGWVQLRECPFCHSQNYHLGITLDGRRSNCYRCGYHKSYDVLSELGVPYAEFKELIRNFINTEIEVAKTGKYIPPTCLVDLADSPRALQYLKSRNLDPEYCQSVWGLQATTWSSNYPHRLFIPICKNKIPVSWTARAMHPEMTPRYQTASAAERSQDPKQFLFGHYWASDSVIVVEGPLDAITIGKGAVALMGLNYSIRQVNLLSRYRRRAILFDAEPLALARAVALAEELSAFPGETLVISLDSGKDANSASESELRQIRNTVFETPERR